MKRRKPINIREANALAAQHLGRFGGAVFDYYQDPETGNRLFGKVVIEMNGIGNVIIYGAHPTSWRKAFEAAGIFDDAIQD